MSNLTAIQATTQALKQAADYVERTQPLLDKYAAERDKVAAERNAYRAQVDKTVTRLVDLGEIKPSKKAELVDKLAADPTAMCQFVEELAARPRGAQSMGQPSQVDSSTLPVGVKRANNRPLSASDRAVLYGDPNAEDDAVGDGHV